MTSWRWHTRAVACGALVGAAALLGSCGSSGSGPDASQASGPRTQSLAESCHAVAAVLSDGPGPTEDPVGYAEAQIRPLAGVRTGDRALRSDIERLDRAYRDVFQSDDSASSALAEKTASARLDAVCPGAAP